MFVFVSQESLKSEWLLFESGYAYGNDVHVVPCCLPGAEMKHLPAPLKLLQAHNVHSAKDLNAITKKCNEVFDTKIPEKFTSQEFASIFRGNTPHGEQISEILWEPLVREINVEIKGPPNGAQIFERLCRRRKLDSFMDRPGTNVKWKKAISAGVALLEESEWFDDVKRERVTGQNECRYTFTLSPRLFGVTAGIIDFWRKKMKVKPYFQMEVSFNYGVCLESITHELTTKLFGSEIRALDENFFLLRDLRFSLARPHPSWKPVDDPHLTIFWVRYLSKIPLEELLIDLLERKVLYLENKHLIGQVFKNKK